jgi:thioredoxin-related protein
MKVLILFLFFFLSMIQFETHGDGFILNSLQEAKDISDATDKPILLIFGTNSCGHCVKLKNDLSSTLKTDIHNFIVCYVDLKLNPEFKKDDNITAIPDSRIIHRSKIVSTIKGYRKSEYQEWLKNAQ